MGGSIAVSNVAGGGAAIEVTLPLTVAGAEADEAAEELPHGTESILLVDDETDVLATQRRLLMRWGYRVSAYADPVTALTTFRKDPSRFDLVLTDLVMPGLNGEALAQEVQHIKPGCPVIINSAYWPDAGPGSAALRFATLAKPTPPHELAKRIRELLDGSRS
jgi:DNA-binding NtrC family response regulator